MLLKNIDMFSDGQKNTYCTWEMQMVWTPLPEKYKENFDVSSEGVGRLVTNSGSWIHLHFSGTFVTTYAGTERSSLLTVPVYRVKSIVRQMSYR